MSLDQSTQPVQRDSAMERITELNRSRKLAKRAYPGVQSVTGSGMWALCSDLGGYRAARLFATAAQAETMRAKLDTGRVGRIGQPVYWIVPLD